jgi:peptidoglycan/LPS O-acetylase OafA/YrhL
MELPSKYAATDEVPSLTGLRFVAAFWVAFAHGKGVLLRIDDLPALHWLDIPAGFGMTLFFVLSGFVIHYNYRKVTTEGVSGVGRFLWRLRFADGLRCTIHRRFVFG